MKKILITACLIFMAWFAKGQSPLVDSLLKKLETAKDTTRVNILNNLCWELRGSEPDKALEYGRQALELATKLSFNGGIVRAHSRIGVIYGGQGKYQEAKDHFEKAMSTAKSSNNKVGMASTYLNFGNLYYYQGNFDKALENFEAATGIYESLNDRPGVANCQSNSSNVYYIQGNYTKAIEYQSKALAIYQELRLKEMEAMSLDNIGSLYATIGDFPRSLRNHLAALAIFEKLPNKYSLAMCYNNIGALYLDQGKSNENNEQALTYLTKALAIHEEQKNMKGMSETLHNLANVKINQGNYPEALNLFKRMHEIARELNDPDATASALAGLGFTSDRLEETGKALDYYNEALAIYRQMERPDGIGMILNSLSEIYSKLGQPAKALATARESLAVAEPTKSILQIKEAKFALASVLKGQNNFKDALKFYEEASVLKDSAFNDAKSREIGRMESSFELDKKDQEIALLNKDKLIQEANSLRQATIRNSLIVGLILILLLAFVLIRSNRQKHRTNLLLTDQNIQIEQQRDNLEKALQDLKSTQSQLIQREKMASLGELTAGIAHEIQNPLNFVNNFSEVNTELIAEMHHEIDGGNIREVKNIAGDIRENLARISQHGKRADAIVKGMLQHSRSGSGQRELTDINALCDEYLRLGYHGMRAKEKQFSATLETHFDTSLHDLMVVPADLGRALLNIFNNAFYAVNEKSKTEGSTYEPRVSVATQLERDKLNIVIRDNGTGIPDQIRDKIYQPFFTTKPSGRGTGLGLSLAYDIITKGHGGLIHLESNEDEGTEFIIQLPYS